MVGQSVYSEMVAAYKPARPASGWIPARRKATRRKNVNDLRLLCGAVTAQGWREGVDLRCSQFHGAGHNEYAWASRFGEVLKYLFPRESGSGESR
jgi:hypothetical protein